MLIICFYLVANSNYALSSDKHYHCETTNFNKKKHKIIERLLNDEIRPKKQTKITSPHKKFVIHYDTTGIDAVDLIDINKNNIPDYVDSVAYYFDYAYAIQVDSMGYTAPIIDSLRGGDNLYDIYLSNLLYDDDALYGYTISEDVYENEFNIITANSFIIIDNNFSIKDSITVNGIKRQAYRTTGIDAVKITSAHEFHHAIQLSYGIPSQFGSLLMEMTSTWMEYKIHNKVYDFTQYVSDLFRDIYNNTFTINNPENGYRWSIFFQYLSKSINDNLILDIWKDIPKNIDFFTSLEKNLKMNNYDIKKVWNDFIPYIYFTSTRRIDSLYLNSAQFMPRIQFTSTEYFNDKLNISKELKPYQIWTSRIINTSNFDKNIESIDIIGSYVLDDYLNNQNKKINLGLNLSSQSIYSNKINYANSIYYDYNKVNDLNQQLVLHIFINDGLRYGDDSFAFTNPNNPINEKLFISLPINSKSISFEYVIYNTEMLQVQKGNSETMRYNGFYGVELDNQKLENGIYYYHLFNKNNNYYGKFSILRK